MRIYVPQSLGLWLPGSISPGPMFPSLYVPRSYVPRHLAMFLSRLCSLVSMWVPVTSTQTITTQCHFDTETCFCPKMEESFRHRFGRFDTLFENVIFVFPSRLTFRGLCLLSLTFNFKISLTHLICINLHKLTSINIFKATNLKNALSFQASKLMRCFGCLYPCFSPHGSRFTTF